MPAVLVEPVKRALAGEGRDVQKQETVVGQQLLSALGEIADQPEPLVGVVVALPRARDVGRVADDEVEWSGDAEAEVVGLRAYERYRRAVGDLCERCRGAANGSEADV